jgi:hypothetical protein
MSAEEDDFPSRDIIFLGLDSLDAQEIADFAVSANHAQYAEVLDPRQYLTLRIDRATAVALLSFIDSQTSFESPSVPSENAVIDDIRKFVAGSTDDSTG